MAQLDSNLMADDIISNMPAKDENPSSLKEQLTPAVAITKESKKSRTNSPVRAGGTLAQGGIRLTPPPGKFLIEIVFELVGLVAAIAFGVFAVKSVTVADQANEYSRQAILQALTSNQLTLLALCMSSGNQVSSGFILR